ncbi:MAG TPA: Gfo/Idh/MocA family oxidoreductase [Vicinamibacterales bacterium]|nr:Gfo/Idh/MocA family oxidoreductase [Vicinamibacterales bacterium]
MKVGILGAGNISDTHARAALGIPGVEIVAVCGTNREKAERMAAKYGGTAYDNLNRFLDHRPLDIVAIGTPSGVHAEQAVAAIERGLHVLCEKPLDVTTKKVDSVIAAAERKGVKVGVFFQDRLKPDIASMKQTIVSGKLGKPIFIAGHVRWYRPPEYYATSKWRGSWALDGGGALMNQAIHTVDVLQWLFGPVARVAGRTATLLHSIKTEDTAGAVLEFENGALGIVEATTSSYPGYARRVEVSGSEGTLILDSDRLAATDLKGSAPSKAAAAEPPPENAASATVSDAVPHQRIFEDFIAAIRANGTPACDAREARPSVAIIEAIYRSAKSGVFEKP